MCSELGGRRLGNPLFRAGLLACEIYHKLLSGATTEHLEESGRSESARPKSFPTRNYPATCRPQNATRYWLHTMRRVDVARNEGTSVLLEMYRGLSRRSKARSG